MKKTRLTIMLPARPGLEHQAALKTLESYRGLFDGGTYVASKREQPVVWGWWDDPDIAQARLGYLSRDLIGSGSAMRKFPLVTDRHLLVSIDVADSECSFRCRQLVDCFVQHYHDEVTQDVVYVAKQDVESVGYPGHAAKDRSADTVAWRDTGSVGAVAMVAVFCSPGSRIAMLSWDRLITNPRSADSFRSLARVSHEPFGIFILPGGADLLLNGRRRSLLGTRNVHS